MLLELKIGLTMEVNYKSKIINSHFLKEKFSKSEDIQISPIIINEQIKIHLICVDGLVDSTILGRMVLNPIITEDRFNKAVLESEIINDLLNGKTFNPFVSITDDYNDMITATMCGMAAFIFDKEKKAVLFDLRAFEKRSVSEPQDEGVMKGAKDSFIEVLRTNTALIRRRLRTEELVIEHFKVGKLSKTDVAIAYINDIVDMNIVNDLRKNINKISIDNISTPAFLEEHLIKNKLSIFPQLMYTERPDRCSANLTEGKAAIIVDGLPFVYLAPCQFVMLMQSPDDYGNHFIIASFLRMIRYIAMILTLFLPSYYIATTTFQNQMLPVQLALSIQNSKVNVPFSSGFEVIGLLIAFEILIEASLRLPKTVGTAMSILGGLVVGQAAIEANLLSPTVVVIVSISGIAGFMMPNQDFSACLRVLRFALSILASIGGFFAIGIGFIFIITHLAGLESYGVSYLYPFVNNDKRNIQDTIFRFPIKYLRTRLSQGKENN